MSCRITTGVRKNIRFITKNVIETISELRNREGKDIWLAGGGKLISMSLAAGFIDQMRIIFLPVDLGKGIPQFPEQPKVSHWKLYSCKVLVREF